MRGAPSDPRGCAVVKDYARVAITQILHNNPRDMHVPLVIDCQRSSESTGRVMPLGDVQSGFLRLIVASD